MPGFMRSFKENQGTHIEGNGESIDVVVREIIGSSYRKEVVVEIRGVPELETAHLTGANRNIDLAPGLNVGIVHKQTSGLPVYLSFLLDEGYRITPKDY